MRSAVRHVETKCALSDGQETIGFRYIATPSPVNPSGIPKHVEGDIVDLYKESR